MVGLFSSQKKAMFEEPNGCMDKGGGRVPKGRGAPSVDFSRELKSHKCERVPVAPKMDQDDAHAVIQLDRSFYILPVSHCCLPSRLFLLFHPTNNAQWSVWSCTHSHSFNQFCGISEMIEQSILLVGSRERRIFFYM